jgi:membrane protease YdiL (CAAX protease family)
MTRAAASRPPALPARAKGVDPVLSYFRRAELPLNSLAFLLPLIVIYEIGTRLTLSGSHVPAQRIIAFTMMQQFFTFFGATGRYLPALAVVGILLGWHIARRDAWQVDVATLFGMTLESLVLAVPLMAIGVLAARYVTMIAAADSRGLLILSIGAGIYEELVFRLIAFTGLHFLFLDLLGMKRAWSYLLMVGGSSVLFAAYHYLGNEAFQWRTFAFRTVAGAYFGAIFVWRGFGITAGCHTAYDMILVLLRVLPVR